MRLGAVVGNLWATKKDDRLKGRRLLLVQPLTFAGAKDGTPYVALDTVDAGVNDVVILATSAEAAIPFRPGLTPTDATIVGIVDRIDHEDWSWKESRSS